MQRERGRRNDLFGTGDSFGGFQGSGMMPSLFGGRDPFDDPFFTRPLGSMFEPSRFEPSSSAAGNASHANKTKGIVIEELDSDDEGVKEEDGDNNNIPRNHAGLGKEPSVEHPDDYDESKNVNDRGDHNRTGGTGSQTHGFSYSKVTYGGVDGAYYTSTRGRRTGTDGVVIEESREADKTTGQATHRISRGIHDKGHSVTRKLGSDGKVDTTQTLHNMNEDELAGFEEAWKGNYKARLPGWSNQFGSGRSEQQGMATWGGLTLPSAEKSQHGGGRTKKVVRINIE